MAVFDLLKCYENLTFDFGFSSRFGISLTDYEPTFGFSHIPTSKLQKVVWEMYRSLANFAQYLHFWSWGTFLHDSWMFELLFKARHYSFCRKQVDRTEWCNAECSVIWWKSIAAVFFVSRRMATTDFNRRCSTGKPSGIVVSSKSITLLISF